MIPGFKRGTQIEQIALFGLSKRRVRDELSGGKVWVVSDLLQRIVCELSRRRIANEVVPEQFPLLRTAQFMCEHSALLFPHEAYLTVEARPNGPLRRRSAPPYVEG
jgi:hypothetical protein